MLIYLLLFECQCRRRSIHKCITRAGHIVNVNVHAQCLSLRLSLSFCLSFTLSHSYLWCIVLRFSIPLPSPCHKPQPTTLLHEHERVYYQRTTSYNHIYVASVVTHTDATCNEVAKKRLVHRNEMLFVDIRKRRMEVGREIKKVRGRNETRQRNGHKCNWKPLVDIFAELPAVSCSQKGSNAFLKIISRIPLRFRFIYRMQ